MELPSTLVSGVLGSVVASLGTALGAALIFLRAGWSNNAQRLMLAVAGGMMLGATFFSLLQPAIELVRERGGSNLSAVGTASLGLSIGAFVLWVVHSTVPHEHFTKGREGGKWFHLGRNGLFVLAIALHNFPEGLSVGVAYGDQAAATGYVVTLGIAAQNLPEGLAVVAALVNDGSSRARAFLVAALTGFVEPVGGLVGATAVSVSEALLPGALAFAAGAMLYVVSGEVIPETHVKGREHSATFAIVGGFIAMMALAILLQ